MPKFVVQIRNPGQSVRDVVGKISFSIHVVSSPFPVMVVRGRHQHLMADSLPARACDTIFMLVIQTAEQGVLYTVGEPFPIHCCSMQLFPNTLRGCTVPKLFLLPIRHPKNTLSPTLSFVLFSSHPSNASHFPRRLLLVLALGFSLAASRPMALRSDMRENSISPSTE